MPDSLRVIAVDAMGGDGAPRATVEGALAALEGYDVAVRLVGPIKRLRRELGRFKALPARLELVDAPDVVGMDEPPVSVLRGKRQSSLSVCARLVRDGRADAMVTAGNTGAAWVAAKTSLGMIPGVERPALAVVLPKLEGQTLLLDVGANVECKPQHLVHFAVMGSFYAEQVLGMSEPRVGLMSVGEEEGKGGRRVRQQYQVLSTAGIRFIGNVEGRDVFSGETDVIVTDGFTGNVILKVAEGLGEMVIGALMDEARRSGVRRRPAHGQGRLPQHQEQGRLLRVRRCTAAGRQWRLPHRPRPLIGQGGSQRRAFRCPVRLQRRDSPHRGQDPGSPGHG